MRFRTLIHGAAAVALLLLRTNAFAQVPTAAPTRAAVKVPRNGGVVVSLPPGQQPPADQELPSTAAFAEADIIGTAVDCASIPEAEDPNALYPLSALKGLLACALGRDPYSAPAEVALPMEQGLRAARHAKAVVLRNYSARNARLFATRGDLLALVPFQDAQLVQVKTSASATTNIMVVVQSVRLTIKEEERESRIATDIATLLKLAPQVLAVSAALAGNPPPAPNGELVRTAVPWVTAARAALNETRATATIERKIGEGTVEISNLTAQALARWKELQAAFELNAFESEISQTCAAGAHPPATQPIEIAYCTLRVSQNPGAEARAAAVEILAASADPRVRSLLQAQLATEADPHVRAAIVKALGTVRAAALPSRQADPAKADPAKTDSEKTESATTLKLTTGPREHWFLTADVLLTGEEKFAANDAGAIDLDGTPPAFYAGVDFLLGDVLDTKRPFWQSIALKGFIKGSKRPQESFGFGIGYRGPFFKRYTGLDLNLLSPFVAVTYTRVVDAAGKKSRDHAVRVGVSLNLDRALTFVSK